jgi:hypothetical protein
VETLADRIAREGPFSELDAVGWAVRLAKRIEAMHALGVTHGSVSAQCVLVEGKDRTAKASLVDVRRTPGSLAYHSPERVSGGGLSQADDTWAVACTLYAALTGGPPFLGANDAELKQKILTAAPAPLAVFDVGDDDLQRVLDDAFARDLAHRTATVSALRKALEEWHPDPNVAGLPGLEDEDTEAGSEGDEEDEDERTIMRPAPMMFARPAPAAHKPAEPATPPALAASPAAVEAPPRARLAAPVPPPRASAPGAAPPPRASAPGAAPPPRVSAPGAVPPPRASAPGAVPPPRASAPGGLPGLSPLGAARPGPAARVMPPAAPPPAAPDTKPPGADDEEEDERTVMRTVPESLAAVIGARPPDASRSGAFAAVPPSRSGAFPAHVAAPADADADADEPEAEEEATRMMASPAALLMQGGSAPADDDDDEDQKTIMRTSHTDDEIGRLGRPAPAAGAKPTAAMLVGDAPPAAPPEQQGVGEGDSPFGGTMTLDALHLAHAQASSDAASAGADSPLGEAARPAEAALGAPLTPPAQAAPALAPSGAAPLVATGPGAVASPSRGRSALWLVLVLLVVVAGGVFAALRFLK